MPEGGGVCGGGTACTSPTDCPATTSDCVTATCGNGCCGTANVAVGTSCTSGGGKVCDGNGNCVACNSPSDCPATGNFCTTATCNSGSCGTSDVASGTALPSGDQTPGDCQQLVCNGSGGTTSQNDATDLPVSSTACLMDPACTGNPLAPTFTDAPTGTDCTADGHPPNHVCGNTSNGNIAGTCVQCNTDADCLAINDAGTLSCDTSTGTCQ